MECQTVVHICKWVRFRWDFSCPHHHPEAQELLSLVFVVLFFLLMNFHEWLWAPLHKHYSVLLGGRDCNWYSKLSCFNLFTLCMQVYVRVCMCTCVWVCEGGHRWPSLPRRGLAHVCEKQLCHCAVDDRLTPPTQVPGTGAGSARLPAIVTFVYLFIC